MKLVRARFVLVIVVAVLSVGPLKAQVTLDATGITDEKTYARVTFSVGGGQSLPAAGGWLVEMTIGTSKIDVTKCQLGQGTGGFTGKISAPLNLPAGKYNVYIKVTLITPA